VIEGRPGLDPHAGGQRSTTKRRRSSTREDAVPRWLRIVLIVLLIAITIVVLFTTVFPWVEQRLEDPTMGVVQVVRSPR
jgi:cell division septal protein FtsQ